MHLLVPFAAPASEAGRQALAGLSLPSLRALLAALPAEQRDEGDELSFTPPHERALARAIGLAGGDGALPWAAWQAARDGLDPGDLAWGLVTPCHWHLGTDQVSLADPQALMLSEAASRELFEAVGELFTSEGFAWRWGAPLRWYAAHESLAALRTASLDRVIGRNVDRWLTAGPGTRLVRRLQNEVQMLLHTHPANARREAQGLLPVNSFWLSGCGVAQPARTPPAVDDRLRRPALSDDWAGWVRAWETLDAGPLADALARRRAGGDVRLTLCGERAAVMRSAGEGWRKLGRLFARPDPRALLESL
ncbi:MAG: hypothetical protein MUF03_07375 [Rubrivivax sp.]|jgi:hypothetical protein|nr:hypothetical protein [Rubrivivax sp.]